MCATKTVYIAEKPSVARAFASALGKNFRSADGYMEAEDTIVTWCVGHLVSMSYPDAYDASLKKWSMATIPFIPEKYKYQVIDGVKKQYGIVKRILTDPEVGTIYICTDSGREGEYIYRLVAAQAGVKGKKELRVWIDSQTEEEILRGIREAKPSSAYDDLGAAAYLRAQEDYLMGINFSRALTLRYSDAMSRALGSEHTTIAVGRVMTCVLGMVVKREREIRSFVKTPFFRIQAVISRPDGETSVREAASAPAGDGMTLSLFADGTKDPAGQLPGAPLSAGREKEERAAAASASSFTAQWQVDEKSICYASPRLYKDTGFLQREDAERMILYLSGRAEADIFSKTAKAADAGKAVQPAPQGTGPAVQDTSLSTADAGQTAQPAPQGTGPAVQGTSLSTADAGPEAQSVSQAPPSVNADKAQKALPGPDRKAFREAAACRVPAVLEKIQRKKEKKNPPLLYNLAELQNDCSRFFKISPDQTLAVAQELYEKKLTTYPRTDARVLTTAVAKEIGKNLRGLSTIPEYRELLVPVLESGTWKKIGKSRYTDDKAVTDHYAIIPTGEGLKALPSLSKRSADVYELIVRRFLSIFYPPAVYDKISLAVRVRTELFTASLRTCVERGYLAALDYSFFKKNRVKQDALSGSGAGEAETAGLMGAEGAGQAEAGKDGETAVPAFLKTARKGMKLTAGPFSIREGETAPPKRYTSGSMILAMENAGQLIEEEELREQIRGSGIGTSATRAEILKKLFGNDYLRLNSRTQVITPSRTGEMIYDTCQCALKPLLDPRLTASWELGLTQVSQGSVTPAEYTQKLNSFITRRTNYIKETDFHQLLVPQFRRDADLYPEKAAKPAKARAKRTGTRTKQAGTRKKRGDPGPAEKA